jgi:hypothetical protein
MKLRKRGKSWPTNDPRRPTTILKGGRSSLLLPAILVLVGSAPVRAGDAPGFSREIQPILSSRCYQCHGPDPATRKARLRLDREEDAFADRGDYAAFVPGRPELSEAFQRMISDDETERMPPPSSGKALSKEEIATVRRWIEQGATWETHWSLRPLARPELPPVEGPTVAGWPRNAIDQFVLSRLKKEGLQPSPEASRTTLIRRLSFDLTGMPPTPAEVDSFVNDPGPGAYEQVVERLLSSQHFGERMAMDWLDAARYSDTDGYQGDATRTNWPWRDWVIGAFNRNLPFDRFTIEQFAGDLLPNATPEQRLATCFHRNHMTNGEGGRDPEESRIDYVIDRVNTVGTVWLGLTLGCCQCHSHKFDPIAQADYYRLSAFFNSIDEDGRAGKQAKPYLSYRSPFAERAIAEARRRFDERKAAEAAARKAAEQAFGDWVRRAAAELRGGFQAWRPFRATAFETLEGTELAQDADGVITARGPDPRHEDYRIIGPVPLPRVTGFRLEVLPDPSHTKGGLSRSATGDFILTDVKVQVRRRAGAQVREVAVADAVASHSVDARKREYGNVKDTLDDDPRNGWASFGSDLRTPHTAVFALAEPLKLEEGEELLIELKHRSTQGRHNIGRFRLGLTDQPGPAVRSVEAAPLEQLAASGASDAAGIDPALRARLFDQFLEDQAPYVAARAALARARAHLKEREAAARVDVMVLAERVRPRETHVLVRGVWDQKGARVEPGVPEALGPWPEGEPATRLGLARWLVSRRNPLTARVAVNRVWQTLLGAGLVRTPEDFGRQGEQPTHPELLDWLAVDLMEHGWDLRHVIRLIVSSATYRQTSESSNALRARDPDNRLLARAARFRLPSWMIRDAALRSSGLLNPALGGPPVFPYQPPGVWEEISMGRNRYEPSEGPDQFRRTIYAFWRRSAAPSFLFDSAQRRVCEVRLPRTNTPLQALTLLNDQTNLVASRRLAENALHAASDEPDRLDELMRRVLSRPAGETERPVLERALHRALDYYREHPDDAARWLAHGAPRPDPGLDAAELAAYAVVADMILNLDEAITRE